MATVTGSGGSTVTLNAGSNDRNGTAAALSAAISTALQNGTLTQTSNTNPPSGTGLVVLSAGGSTALAAAVTAVLDAGGTPTTVSGSSALGQQILGDNGGLSYFAAGGSGTIVAGDGNNVFTEPTIGAAGFNVTFGNGNDLIEALSGNNTISAGGGVNLIGLGNSNSSVILGGSLDYVFGNTTGTGGSDTVFGGPGNAILVPGGSNLYFVGGAGSATVYGGTGTETVFAGAGGGVFAGGSAGKNILVGSLTGASTLFGGGNGDTLFARGSGVTTLAAGPGNETLTGAGSTANNTFFGNAAGADLIQGGAGNDTIVAGASSTINGGAGANLIVFQAGRSSGTEQINGFNPAQGDRATLLGLVAGEISGDVAAAKAVTVNGVASTQITLSNGTNIQFTGVTNLATSNFI